MQTEKPIKISDSNKNNIIFLGTGSADWSDQKPQEDNYGNSRNWRRKSCVLVNGSILIDCGPTVLEAISTFNINPFNITDILLTHTHTDHFSLDTLRYLVEIKGINGLHLWGHYKALQKITGIEGLIIHPIEAGDSFNIGDAAIKALPANHSVSGSEEVCLYYLLKNREVQWLYATDGAWLLKTTWLYLLRNAKLDMIIWDATIGEAEDDYRVFEHNSLAMIRLMTKTLTRQGIINDNTRIILTHMARTLHPEHNELERTLAVEGMIPAYDGMQLFF